MTTLDPTRGAREADAQVAERIMGWRRQFGSFAGTSDWKADAVSLHPYPPAIEYPKPPDYTDSPVTFFDNTPKFSSDPVACAAMEAKLVQDGKGEQYAEALLRETCEWWHEEDRNIQIADFDELLKLITATCAQKVAAALSVYPGDAK